MSRSYLPGKFIQRTVLLTALLLMAGWLIFSSLPLLMNQLIIPSVLEKKGLHGLSIQVQSLYPTSLVTNITVHSDEGDIISVPHLRLNYSTADIIRGKIDTVLIDSASLKLAVKDGKITIPGLSALADNTNASTRNDQNRDLRKVVPAFISRIVYRNCQIVVHRHNGPNQVIILDGAINTQYAETASPTLESLIVEIKSQGGLSSSSIATINFNQDSHAIELSAIIEDLQQIPTTFTGLTDSTDNIRLRGLAHINCSARFAENFTALEDITAQLKLSDFTSESGQLSLHSGPENLLIEVAGPPQMLTYTLNKLIISSPQAASLTLSGTLLPEQKRLTGDGELTAETLEMPTAFHISVSGEEQQLSGLATLSGDSQRLSIAGKKVELGKYTLSSRLHVSTAATRLQNNFHLDSFSLPEVQVRGNELNGSFSYKISQTAGSSIDVADKDTITLQSLQYKNERMADLHATVLQAGQDFRLSGVVTSQMQRALKLRFEATVSPDMRVDATLKVPKQTITTSSFPSFIRIPDGLSFSGKLAAQARVRIRPQKTDWNLHLQLNDGKLNTKDDKVMLSGINTELTFPGLSNFSSDPGQQLQIQQVELGNIKLTNGLITYHLENPQTIFFEKSRFNWCSGKVESGSLRVAINDPVISTVLYCDRLQFSELLGQIGITEASGNGSLNGRLPIYYSKKEMVFDDGFLFSTPGDSGIVRFSNTSMLRQGMGNLDQAVYLDYSLQSMENFSYNWTKLTFNTQGDDLLIAMQIDGKPATPLPYGYKKGQMVKMKGAGIQHPIRLDVNFHLPFTQIFKYGQNLQKIMENM